MKFPKCTISPNDQNPVVEQEDYCYQRTPKNMKSCEIDYYQCSLSDAARKLFQKLYSCDCTFLPPLYYLECLDWYATYGSRI